MQVIHNQMHFVEPLEVKQSNAKTRKIVCWKKSGEQSHGEKGLFEENALLTFSTVWVESGMAPSIVPHVLIKTKLARLSTQQYIMSKDLDTVGPYLCACQVCIVSGTSMQTLRAVYRASLRCIVLLITLWCKRFLFNYNILVCLPCSLNFLSFLVLVCDLLDSLTSLPKPPKEPVLSILWTLPLKPSVYSLDFVVLSFLLKPHDLMVLFLLLIFSGTAVSSALGTKLVNSPMFYFQAWFLPSGCFSEFVFHYV